MIKYKKLHFIFKTLSHLKKTLSMDTEKVLYMKKFFSNFFYIDSLNLIRFFTGSRLHHVTSKTDRLNQLKKSQILHYKSSCSSLSSILSIQFVFGVKSARCERGVDGTSVSR
ncbi:MAG: hypothetical protein GY714_03410 [Desulfobacterales bacterium]|nr:hypothetical protein [Desulfobacterales bacterium]